MNAVLLAGGRGKRLRPLTDTLPKPLVPIADKPILQWQIEWLRGCGVSSFMLSVGYLPDQIRSHFGDGRKYGVEIQYIVEHEPLGTAGALRKALEESGIDSPVFVANGDVLTNLDPKEAEARRDEQGLVGSICLVPLPSPYGIVDVDGDRIVRSFREKPVLSDYWINAGVYALAPEIFPYLPSEGSLENEVFPLLSRQGKLLGCRYKGCFWQSIDSHKDIEETARRIEEMNKSGGVVV